MDKNSSYLNYLVLFKNSTSLSNFVSKSLELTKDASPKYFCSDMGKCGGFWCY